MDHVCGINGLTYASACAAIYCGGLAPFDFVAGDCQEVVSMTTVSTVAFRSIATDKSKLYIPQHYIF